MKDKTSNISFEKVLKESNTFGKKFDVLKKIKECFESIEKTEDPIVFLARLRGPIVIIWDSLIKYGQSIILREAEINLVSPSSLSDIQCAIDYYDRKLMVLSKNFKLSDGFSKMDLLSVDRDWVIQSINYAIEATKNCCNYDEKKIIIEVIGGAMLSTNGYINFINEILEIENRRRISLRIPPLKLHEIILWKDVGISGENLTGRLAQLN